MEIFRPPHPPTKQTSNTTKNAPQRDFLTHVEQYLSKRDSIDKLLKISRYASKIILCSSFFQESNNPLSENLKSFECSVGLSRKALRLGKFIQDINAFRSSEFCCFQELIIFVVAYGGEGLYYFVEQFVWVVKSGLISRIWLNNLEKLSAWFEIFGYVGSVWLKVRELGEIGMDERCLVSSMEVAELREIGCREELERLRKVREVKLMKRVAILQDLADGLVALAVVRGGKGQLLQPLVVSLAGLLSALISSHRNWFLAD
ncbi:hypothetical protein Leryth_012938 [Lithospermum erythrorhizon]|nr:hypothetical protein Leryth_012938 [Lithospermum erythrorhizon]